MSVNHDIYRKTRTGIPEVILAGPKTNQDLEASLEKALKSGENILVTRIKKEQIEIVTKIAKDEGINYEFDRYKRTCILGSLIHTNSSLCQVAILSGGTSDGIVVEEIRMVLKFFNQKVEIAEDVGVAGIHRHQEVLKRLERMDDIKIMIVVAGSEGALFSVVSAQTKLPIIAVPTSTGYGFGGKGLGALQSALQSCSPGVVTVNIDNGFGAASFVAKFLNQITGHDE